MILFYDTLFGGDGDDTLYGATIIGESGVESVLQDNASTWFTVTFAATIINPGCNRQWVPISN